MHKTFTFQMFLIPKSDTNTLIKYCNNNHPFWSSDVIFLHHNCNNAQKYFLLFFLGGVEGGRGGAGVHSIVFNREHAQSLETDS